MTPLWRNIDLFILWLFSELRKSLVERLLMQMFPWNPARCRCYGFCGTWRAEEDPSVSGKWKMEDRCVPWWRHQMEIFSALPAICAGNSPVTGEFPAQRPVTRSFDVFFDLRLNRWLSKQWWGWWFETPSRPLWRHCNVYIKIITGYPHSVDLQHYSNATGAPWRPIRLKLLVQQTVEANTKENIKTRHYWHCEWNASI